MQTVTTSRIWLEPLIQCVVGCCTAALSMQNCVNTGDNMEAIEAFTRPVIFFILYSSSFLHFRWIQRLLIVKVRNCKQFTATVILWLCSLAFLAWHGSLLHLFKTFTLDYTLSYGSLETTTRPQSHRSSWIESTCGCLSHHSQPTQRPPPAKFTSFTVSFCSPRLVPLDFTRVNFLPHRLSSSRCLTQQLTTSFRRGSLR
jgi:hypothetical protein